MPPPQCSTRQKSSGTLAPTNLAVSFPDSSRCDWYFGNSIRPLHASATFSNRALVGHFLAGGANNIVYHPGVKLRKSVLGIVSPWAHHLVTMFGAVLRHQRLFATPPRWRAMETHLERRIRRPQAGRVKVESPRRLETPRRLLGKRRCLPERKRHSPPAHEKGWRPLHLRGY